MPTAHKQIRSDVLRRAKQQFPGTEPQGQHHHGRLGSGAKVEVVRWLSLRDQDDYHPVVNVTNEELYQPTGPFAETAQPAT